MGWLRYFRRQYWADERARELQDYLAHEIDDNIARGMPRDQAARAARLKLGNPTRIREDIYEMNTLRLLETVWQDLRYGARLLARTPSFSAVAILTLALGTGANAAIFQVVNAVRLRPLPVANPAELVSVGIDNSNRIGRGHGGRSVHTEPLLRAIQEHQQAFSSIIAWGTETWDLATEGEFRPVQGLYVTGNYFDVLGVRPAAGRLFTAADDHTACGTPGAVLSYGFWHSRYNGSPAAVGQTIMLDRRAFEIVGVARRGFFGVEVGRSFDVAVPLCAEPLIRGEFAGTNRRHVWWLDIIGRLQPGWSIERADAHLRAISPGIFAATVSETYNARGAETYRAFTLEASSARTGVSNVRSDYAAPIWILLGATGLVLLLTCANLTNLMLARATARDREVAVRLALGASRRRIVRQMLCEGLLIAAAGAAGGLVLAGWLSPALVAFLSTDEDRLFLDLAVDWRVYGFIFFIGIGACLLLGLSPALKATGHDPGQALHAGGRTGSDARETLSLRRGLVVLQVALSLVLVVGALLFGRSLRNLASIDPGFNQEILVASVDLRRTAIQTEERHPAIEGLLTRVRSLPGVERAAEALVVPLAGAVWNQPIVVGGVRQEGLVNFNQVGAGFFQTMGIPLAAGRIFDTRDRLGAPLVAIVNETFARRYLRSGSPVGQTFHMEAVPGRPQPPPYQVVGVVEDTKYAQLREEFTPIAYLPFAQEAEPYPIVSIVLRSGLPRSALTPSLTRAITEAVPGAGVSYDTIRDYVRNSLVTERAMASLSGFFGLLGVLIAALGLYGVMSYAVSRRRMEIGIRMALGADASRVVRMVLLESGVLVAAGLAVGFGLAFAAARSAAAVLYGLEPLDPASFLVGIATLVAIGIAASWIPARRASRLSPTVALRE